MNVPGHSAEEQPAAGTRRDHAAPTRLGTPLHRTPAPPLQWPAPVDLPSRAAGCSLPVTVHQHRRTTPRQPTPPGADGPASRLARIQQSRNSRVERWPRGWRLTGCASPTSREHDLLFSLCSRNPESRSDSSVSRLKSQAPRLRSQDSSLKIHCVRNTSVSSAGSSPPCSCRALWGSQMLSLEP